MPRRGMTWGLGALCLLACAMPGSASASPRCTMVGSNGPDVLLGTPGPDVICGRGGKDQISGGRGADRVVGGPGDDRLNGGPGVDHLIGGTGEDECRDSGDTVRRGCELPDRGPGSPRGRSFPDACCFTDVLRETQPPEIFWLSISPHVVDTSQPGAGAKLVLEVWDASGVRSIGVEIEGPDGPWKKLDLEGQSAPLTALEVPLNVGPSTAAGKYRITSLTLTDREGNTSSRDEAQLAASDSTSTFDVFHGPDNDAPELSGFEVPETVDTTDGPVDVPVTIGATDAVSGVDTVVATIVRPDDQFSWVVIGGGFDGLSRLVSGTRNDGSWERTDALDEDAPLGYYRVVSVRLRDIAGNERNYNFEELRELGFPNEFLDTGGPDTTAPEITGFWFDPLSLRTSAGERTIEFYTQVRDDISGFGGSIHAGSAGRVDVDVEPAFPWTEFMTSGKVPVLVSGSRLDGVWQQELSLEEDAAAGEYLVDSVSATDRAGNQTVLHNGDLAALNFQHSFVNEP